MDKTPVLKLILIGDSGVGKTSIIERFVDGKFDPIHVKPTTDNEAKVMYMSLNGCKVVLRILDTVGMERFDSITNSYYRLSHGVLVVYDVTNLESFQSVSSWMNRVREFCPEAAVLIVGNKTDQLVGNTVNVKTVKRLADIEGLDFIETSALDDINVKEAFHQLLRLILLKTQLVDEDEDVDFKMLTKPSLDEIAELDMLVEQQDKQREYKKNLEKLIQRQLVSSEETINLPTTDEQSTETEQETKKPSRRCC